MISFGIDPGVTTGYAAWDTNGLIHHGQGPLLQVLREWIPYLKEENVRIVVIESAFIGKSAYSSLEVAGSAKFIEGAIWCAGIDAKFWRPKANSWRSKLGFPGSIPTPNGPKKSRRAKSPDYEANAFDFTAVHVGHRLEAKRIHEAEAICMAAAGFERLMEGKA